MSHTTKISSVAIRDVAAMRAAVATLQNRGIAIELAEQQTPRMYFKHQEQAVGVCDYVLKLQGRYDVGLQKQEDGTYSPIFDEWDNDVHKSLGAACNIPKTDAEKSLWAIGQFSQEYAKHAAINAAVSQGYYVEGTTTDEQGNVQVVLAGM